MKVLVCGSRDWPDRGAIHTRVRELRSQYADRELVIIHGNAQGADREAAHAARLWGIADRPFPADWKTHGKRAGYLRNVQMLDQQPALVIAFQRNDSRGTQHTIDEARKRGIPVEVHTT